MIAAIFVIVVALIAIYIAVGVETAMAAHDTGRGYEGDEDVNLDKAHMYLSWATSITWISIGLSIVGIILLVILGIFGAVVIIPEAAVSTSLTAVGIALKKNEKKVHKGFLGVQALNEMKGFVGVTFKIFFFGVLMLMTGVGILSTLGLVYILRSASKSGLWNAFVAVVLSFLPLVIVVILEIINYRVVSRTKAEIEEQKQEIIEMKKDNIRAKIKQKETATSTTESTPAVPTSESAQKTASTTDKSSLYSFNTSAKSTPTTDKSSLYSFATDAMNMASGLYSF